MTSNEPRLIQAYLLSGTLEGVRIIELSESSIKAFAIPRLKLQDIKDRPELNWPSLYFLIGADESRAYIGESESFYHRVKNHDQNKEFWDLAIAIVSSANNLGKSDVKYLESLAVERAQGGSMEIVNKTIPTRNNIHEFKLHSLERILDDAQLIISSLGYDVLPPQAKDEQIWFNVAKRTQASATFRGDKFVVLAGSVIDPTHAESWARSWPKSLIERQEILKQYGKERDGIVELTDNVAFKSPNHAGGFTTGRNVNAWIVWRDS
ncbi:MAG TPA: GIY-YIG nuclease family protein, partial [Candidatus Polarisedimenticolaceae bacterium]|nr:GIY-YIG nuclease family protein [Candidatus Polarisedimenticolaceae bacterium]